MVQKHLFSILCGEIAQRGNPRITIPQVLVRFLFEKKRKGLKMEFAMIEEKAPEVHHPNVNRKMVRKAKKARKEDRADKKERFALLVVQKVYSKLRDRCTNMVEAWDLNMDLAVDAMMNYKKTEHWWTLWGDEKAPGPAEEAWWPRREEEAEDMAEHMAQMVRL